MNETKFTPGPWEAKYDHLICGPMDKRSKHHDGRIHVARVLGVSDGFPRDVRSEVRANACLIEAAPALYRTLKEIVDFLDESGLADSKENWDLWVLMMAGQAELARARGEEV